MSIEVTELVRCRDLPRPAMKAVLLDMSYYADDQGKGVWASVASIEAGTGLKRTAVRTAIDDLLKLGVIKLVDHKKGKHGFTNHYDIDLDALRNLPSNKLAKSERKPGRETTPTRSANDPLPGRETTPNSNWNSYGTVSDAEKTERWSEVKRHAREEDGFDHLTDDEDFAEFLKNEQRRYGPSDI